MRRVLVDSDVYAYAAGGATQRTMYDVGALLPDGDLVEQIVDSKDAVTALKAEEWPAGTEFIVTPVVHAEPESHAIHLVKRSLQAIERAMDAAGVKFHALELFMTGGGNFRDKVATIKGYKANRIGVERPYHYAAIRRYLTRAWHATTVEGYEADDALAMAAHADPTVVICSQDKDLRNVVGTHYNARKREWTTVTPEMARLHFYRQLITGDSTDHIGGCWRSGAKDAAGIAESMSEIEMYEYALFRYRASLTKSGCPYAHMTAEDALCENARLLHLLRHEGDLWTPPTSRT